MTLLLSPLQQKQSRPPADQKKLRGLWRVFFISLALSAFFGIVVGITAAAADVNITVNAGDTAGDMGALEVIFLFAFLALLPSILMMMTSFTRIIIVLGFLRSALGTAQTPPNMVLIGLAFFLSLFIMMPTINQMKTLAYDPYQEGLITGTEAIEAATVPVKEFMLKQTTDSSLRLFLSLSGTEIAPSDSENYQESLLQLPLTVITPAFITSELSSAFMMGFLIYLPFLVVDMVVSSILMSMGMVMLPPAMISMPFKLLLFVLVDGWGLMIETLVNSFR